MASPETLQINAINATWAGASGAATDIDEPIGSPDTAYYGAGLEDDAADFGFGASEVVDGDTVTGISFNLIYRDDGGAGNLLLDVDLLIGGVVQGTTQQIAVTGSDATYSNINHSGWNVDRTAAEMDGMELRLTPRQSGMPGTNAGFLETANAVVTWTAGSTTYFETLAATTVGSAGLSTITTFLQDLGATAVGVAGLIVNTLRTGVWFDGIGDWLDGIDTTSSMSDGKKWAYSFWVWPSSSGSLPRIRWSGASAVGLSFVAGDASSVKLRARLENDLGTVILDQTTDDADIKFDRWNHCCGNVDLNVATQKADMVINRVTQTFTSPTITDDDIDFTRSSNSIGATAGSGTFPLTGALQEYWEHTDNIDFTTGSELNKVITPEGKPVILGADGAIPTGTQPHIYLRDPYNSWETNYGSLGDFTVNGTLTDEGTKPELPADVVQQALVAVAIGVAALAVVPTYVRTLAATAIGVAALSTLTTWFRTLAATAIGVADLVRKTSKTLGATALGTATLLRKTSKTLAATALASATLVAATLYARTLAAVALGLAGLAPLAVLGQTLAATVIGVAGLSTMTTWARTLAATAVGVAGLTKGMFVTLGATALGTATLLKKTSKTLVATAVGSATLTGAALYEQALTAVALGVATLTAVYTAAAPVVVNTWRWLAMRLGI